MLELVSAKPSNDVNHKIMPILDNDAKILIHMSTWKYTLSCTSDE